MIRSLIALAVCLPFFATLHAQHNDYAGRYTDGKDYAVYFEETPYGLTIRPVLWTATQLLRETDEEDKFVVVDRTSRGAEFLRDVDGEIVGVKIVGMEGEGLELRPEAKKNLAIELLADGRGPEAAAMYIARREPKKAIEAAEQVLIRIPTRTHAVELFLRTLAPLFDTDAQFHTLLGYALVQAGKRGEAVGSFRRALRLDPKNERAISALARLKELPADNPGWKLPFALSSVFAKPTAAEITAIEQDWAKRDLKAAGIKEELKSAVTIAGRKFKLRLVSHLVHGKRHFGAIISPPNAKPGCCPVIIEAKGVSPTYFSLDLEKLASPRFMDDIADRFVYVVPTFRGEVLNFNGHTYTSEGDRTDALDGATDDAIALLNVALETTPEIDSKRICAFGHSRGGNVVMLAGIRDKRIRCIVNWAGPTDWFYAMGTNGWTEEELWAEGLRTRATPQQTGGQNVERFLSRAINGNATLREVRNRMIASSPLYFAYRMPPGQHHYGIEDPFVPVRNGRELMEQMVDKGMEVSTSLNSKCDRSRSYQMFFYPGQGHDTDRMIAPLASRWFIARQLEVKYLDPASKVHLGIREVPAL